MNAPAGLDLADKIQLAVSYALRLTLVLAIGTAILSENWLTMFMASLVLVLSFSLSLIERNVKMFLPVEFEFATTLFIYGSLFLGEVHGYYTRFWWWDLVLHSFAGVTFGIVGFLVMYVLLKGHKVAASPVLIALFSFCFAVAIGSVWEIFEFSMDSVGGLNMQKSGLVDTMWDMMVNAGGALVISIIGFFYVRGGESLIMRRVLSRLVERNPRLFKNRNV